MTAALPFVAGVVFSSLMLEGTVLSVPTFGELSIKVGRGHSAKRVMLPKRDVEILKHSGLSVSTISRRLAGKTVYVSGTADAQGVIKATDIKFPAIVMKRAGEAQYGVLQVADFKWVADQWKQKRHN